MLDTGPDRLRLISHPSFAKIAMQCRMRHGANFFHHQWKHPFLQLLDETSDACRSCDPFIFSYLYTVTSGCHLLYSRNATALVTNCKKIQIASHDVVKTDRLAKFLPEQNPLSFTHRSTPKSCLTITTTEAVVSATEATTAA